MSMIREIINAALWQGNDPFLTVTRSPDELRESSLATEHDTLDSFVVDANAEPLPRIVVIAGAGMGAATIRIADLFRQRRHDGVVIAVDTWLGSWEDWCERDSSTPVRLNSAGATPREAFMARVLANDVHGYVVPLPLDDPNAYALLKRKNISVDLVQLDGRVGRSSVDDQLRLWWPLLREGGRLIVDIEQRSEHSFLQAKQATEIFAAGYGAAFESADTMVRIGKPTASLASNQWLHVRSDRPDIPLTLDYEGEFGPELVLFLPYVTWLSRAGLLRHTRVVIYAGMRCFYDDLECAELVEKHSPRRYILADRRLASLPVKSELLYDVADLSPFHAFPDFRKKFGQMPITRALDGLAKPLLIVHNKYAVEWNRPPINFLSLDVLGRLFSTLSDAFTIVYIRHGMAPEPQGYSRDDNFTLPFDDRSVLDAHPDVLCFDDLYAEYSKECPAQDVNTFKNVLYSRCHHFISSQGGGAAHMSFFSGSLLMVLHRYGREERLAYGNGPYGFVANPAPVRVICLNDDELLSGLRLFQSSSVMDGRVMIAGNLEPLLHELSPWTIEKRRNGKWSR